MATSSIPTAITNLVAMAETAVTGDVYDGPAVVDAVAAREVFIGVQDPEGEGFPLAVSDGEQEWATTGKTRDERYRIHCLAVAVDGAGRIPTARTNAFADVAAIESALRTDPTIDGAILYCDIEIRQVDGAQTEDAGAVVRVYFDVRCRARI